MGLFDNKEINNKIKDLEKSLGKLISQQDQFKAAISQMRNEFAEAVKRSPDFEKEAQYASKKTSEYRNRANETYDQVKRILESSKLAQGNINQIKNELTLLARASRSCEIML